MDQPKIVEALGNLTGAVTALEVQTHALLLAIVGAGVHPDAVLRALEAVPKPNVPCSAKATYNQIMAGFWQRLDEAAFEFLAPDPKRESGPR